MRDEVDPRNSGAYRAARLAVIILSTLFVLAILAVAAGFVRQYRLLHAARTSSTAVADPATGAAAVVTLAPGARIVSAATDAGKLVLHVQTPSGGEVEIIDLASGRLTGQVKTSP